MSCERFEELFIKETHNELMIHIQSCDTCMREYERMLKTERLIKEAKPYFINQTKNVNLMKMAASLALIMITSFAVYNSLYVPKLSYDDSVSSVFPVDEYGLLDIR